MTYESFLRFSRAFTNHLTHQLAKLTLSPAVGAEYHIWVAQREGYFCIQANRSDSSHTALPPTLLRRGTSPDLSSRHQVVRLMAVIRSRSVSLTNRSDSL